MDPLYIRPVEPRKQKKVVQNISMEKHWSLTINFFLHILILYKHILNMIINILFIFFMQAKPQNWLGETIFFLIAWIKNFMLG